MGKTLKYVSEFSFPSDKGYSGSAGKQMVKGYARGGACGPMKKADGGMVERESVRFIPGADVGKFMRVLGRGTLPSMVRGIARDMALSDFEEEGRRAVDESRAERSRALTERAREMFGSNPTEGEMQFLMRGEARKPVSQGLRSPRAEMARERALMGEDAGYKKGGMAMRKQYPTNRSEPMIKMAKGGAAPKSDMLFSKKEVNAKNLLADGKGAPMPHPKGSVNMAKGGQAKVGKVMGEFKEGKLHSGSKSGPVVKSRKQAIAIGLSEARAAKKK
jgi:hypothetical protein